jgi:hypothetical protein
MPSINILIATIGRPTLQNMLDSILPNITRNDHVTIVFDGVPPTQLNLITQGHVHIHHEPTALGFWGHGIRNKYKTLLERTDFVLHADDDDVYTPDTFKILRRMCTETNALYIARMDFKGRIVPKEASIVQDDIGTPNGIIPYDLNAKGVWGNYVGGDGEFYRGIAKDVTVFYINHIIYKVRP